MKRFVRIGFDDEGGELREVDSVGFDLLEGRNFEQFFEQFLSNFLSKF